MRKTTPKKLAKPQQPQKTQKPQPPKLKRKVSEEFLAGYRAGWNDFNRHGTLRLPNKWR